MREVDPVTTQVIRNALVALADEMKLTILNTAYNALLYETEDFGVALTNCQGELLAQSSGVQDFMYCVSATIQNGLHAWGSENLEEGDVIIANDPYSTGTHMPDVAVYMPIFYRGKLVAFSGNMAHWADIGGKTPGGWCPDCIDVYQEGLRFTHQKLYHSGEPDETLLSLILANVRYPDTVKGDLRAQIAACRTGVHRYQTLCEKYGAEVIKQAMEQAFDQGERLARNKIKELPDGVYEEETWLDSDGVELDEPVKIKLCAEIRDDSLIVDTKGSAEAAKGPINMPYIGTYAAVATMFKSVFFPLEALNAGHLRPLSVIAEPDTVVYPQLPAPCDSYGYIGEVLYSLFIRVMAQAAPEKCIADTFCLSGAYLYRVNPRDGKPFILIDVMRGGHGARPFEDGPSLVFFGGGESPNAPCEVLERQYPILIDRYTFDPSVAGPGKYRGGFGVIEDYRMLEDHILVQTSNERTKFPPRGLFGGKDAKPTRIVLWPETEKEKVLFGRFSGLGPFCVGEIVSVRTGGGGGWGSPLERDPELVREDVVNAFFTLDDAAREYGVVLKEGPRFPEINWEATEVLRRERTSLHSLHETSG